MLESLGIQRVRKFKVRNLAPSYINLPRKKKDDVKIMWPRVTWGMATHGMLWWGS